jgi:hypothetical protein
MWLSSWTLRCATRKGSALIRKLGDGNVVDVHAAGLNSFQCPSEMTSTPPSVTLMAV